MYCCTKKVILDIEEKTGKKVTHQMKFQVESSSKSYRTETVNYYHMSTHFFSEDGLEIGYFCIGFDTVHVFPDGRKWDKKLKDSQGIDPVSRWWEEDEEFIDWQQEEKEEDYDFTTEC